VHLNAGSAASRGRSHPEPFLNLVLTMLPFRLINGLSILPRTTGDTTSEFAACHQPHDTLGMLWTPFRLSEEQTKMGLPEKALVIVRRPRRTLHFRALYKVEIDGGVAATLKAGDECHIGVTAGHHDVRVCLGTRYTSPEWGVDLQPGEVGKFECRAYGSPLMTSFNHLLGKPHVDLYPVP
jgi:hypothetical protein